MLAIGIVLAVVLISLAAISAKPEMSPYGEGTVGVDAVTVGVPAASAKPEMSPYGEGTVGVDAVTVGVPAAPIEVNPKEPLPDESVDDVGVTATTNSTLILRGRYGPYSVNAGSSIYRTVSFSPYQFSSPPRVVWTNEVYPYTARAYYAIDRNWIGTNSFDARITAVDTLSNNYINWIAIGTI